MTAPRNPYKLDQLGFVGRGRSRHRPRNDPALYGGEYPFFQTGDVKAAEFYLRDYVQTHNDVGLAQSKMWRPGTLCITIAANIAETAILSVPGCFPDSVVGFIADPDKADTAFVKCYLDTLKLSMQSISRGTTQDNLNLEKLLTFDLLVPEVGEQRRIASILSAYDDLIENNTRRIAILEEMARRLYEEWFVHFRLPEGQVGAGEDDLPEGWATERLADAAHLTMGQAPPSDSYNKSGEGLPFHQGVSDFGPFFPVDRQYCTAKARIAEEGDVLFSVRAPVGRLNVATKTITIGRGLAAIRHKRGCQAFLLSQLRHKFAEEDSIGGGTIFKAVTKKDMESIELLRPPEDVIKRFEDIVVPIWRQIRILSDKNINLRAQRDLLLPKLVSGEIDVSDVPLPDEEATAA